MYVDRVFLTRLRRYSEHLAATDPLTEIANRRSFETYVQGLIDEPGDEPRAARRTRQAVHGKQIRPAQAGA